MLRSLCSLFFLVMTFSQAQASGGSFNLDFSKKKSAPVESPRDESSQGVRTHFGPEYATWKMCSEDSVCVLVEATPPCRCGADTINKAFVEVYQKQLLKIQSHWTDEEISKVACEPCPERTDPSPKCVNQTCVNESFVGL